MPRDDLAGAGVPLQILDASETEAELDEGPGHRGPAQVTRLVARRVTATT